MHCNIDEDQYNFYECNKMRYVTLLLSGVPQNVPLIKLSCCLDSLFDTDEIGTFKLRALSNEDGKRQIAIDFRSGFDAIAAQERLDGYHYELPNGPGYKLSAKITRKKEFLRTRSPSPEYWPMTGSPVKEGWQAMALVPTVSDGTMFRAHAKLDAQLELLKKQKLILQTEREVLREKKKLKRDYSHKGIIDSDEEASTKRRRRSRSRESTRSRERSNSRDLKLYSKSSRSRELMIRSRSRRSKLLAIRSSSMEPLSKLRELRSRSRDRGLRSSKHPGSRSRELRSRSRDRGIRSRDCGKNRSRTRDRDRNTWSPSWDNRRRSTSRERVSRKRRSRSRDHASAYYKMKSSRPPSPWEWDIIGRSSLEQRSRRDRKSRSREPDHSSISRVRHSRWDRRLRSPEPSFRPRAIMPRSPVQCRSPNERYRRTDDTGNDSDVDYYKRSFYDETPRCSTDIKKATSGPEINKNCTITRDSSPNKEESAAKDRTKQITIYIDVIPKKAADSDKSNKESDNKPTAENDKIEIGNYSIDETNLSTDKIVYDSANEIEIKSTDAKDTIVRNKKKTETERKRIASEDVMFLMQTLVDEISIREKITVSENGRKILNYKLKSIVQDRITPLAANESATNLEVLLRYRELYTKQDDLLLIKKLLDKIPQEINSTAEAAGQVAENTITKEIEKLVDGVASNTTNNPVNTVTIGPDTQSNISVTSVVSNTTEVIEIFDSGLGDPTAPHLDCRDKSDKNTACSTLCDGMIDKQVPVTVINLTLDNDKYTKKGQVPKRPQFVLVFKKLLKQLKQSISKAEKKGNQPFPMMQFTNFLRRTLKDIVMGKGYMTTAEIVKNFREKHPKDKDDEFVDKAMEEIKSGKYGAGIVVVDDDEDDVVLIEKKYDVVTILDSDDEQVELLEKIDNLIKEKPIKRDNQCIKREEAGATLQSQDKTSTEVKNNSQAPLVISEVPQVETNNSVLKDLTVKQELPFLHNLIEQYGVTDKETTSNDVSNNNETLVENINNEVKTELMDVVIENLVDSLKNIDGLDAGNNTTETETPQVTSITIMTSYSELCSLKYNNEKNIKQVNEIKRENDMNEENNDHGNGKTLNNKSNNEIVGSLFEKIKETVNKDSEIAAPVIEDINNIVTTTVKNGPQEEEESIESIIKYVESFCNGLSQ